MSEGVFEKSLQLEDFLAGVRLCMHAKHPDVEGERVPELVASEAARLFRRALSQAEELSGSRGGMAEFVAAVYQDEVDAATRAALMLATAAGDEDALLVERMAEEECGSEVVVTLWMMTRGVLDVVSEMTSESTEVLLGRVVSERLAA